MAFTPLKQTVTIIRPGEEDEWGEYSTPPISITMKCRVDEGSKIVQGQLGDEVVSGMEITFDKLPDIRYSDQIEYINELGVRILRTPIRIEPLRMPNGKPAQTAVYL